MKADTANTRKQHIVVEKLSEKTLHLEHSL